MKFIDGTKKDSEFFALDAVVKLVISKDLLEKAGEYFWHFFLSDDPFFEANTVKEIDDSD
jgi:hypothetical protein